jgi:hypothetical protein
MDEFVFTSTAERKKANYLFGYYHRPFFWLQRRFMGPILIVLAAVAFALNPGNAALDAMLAVFGAYYIARPFIARARMRFEASSLRAAFRDGSLSIVGERSSFLVKPEEVLKAKLVKGFVFLKIRQTAVQWIMFDTDSLEAGKDEFVRRILAFRPDAS